MAQPPTTAARALLLLAAHLDHHRMPSTHPIPAPQPPRLAIIARQSAAAGGLAVGSTRHEVMWPDGSAVQLHPVLQHGSPHATLRAVRTSSALQLVDLATLQPTLADDMAHAHPRDWTGLVFYTLRGAYTNASAFTTAATQASQGEWWPMEEHGYVWQSAPRRPGAAAC